MPVPLESTTSDISAEDVMGLAGELFSPCYLSGWTAAEHWGLTEQLFQSIVVVTQTKKKNYRPKILDTEYVLFLAPENRFFGLKIVWPGNIPVKIVDSTRLMLDILYRPEMAGGIRSASDFFSAYLSSDKRNIPLLMDYLRQFKSGVTSKRLGFLAEKFCPEEKVLIDLCLHTITKGYSKLDPDLSCTIHLARWNLLIPENWR
jgi:predicted transcriptional regulator of viral defense system